MRAHLDKDVVTIGDQPLYGLGEQHRLPEISHPVGAIELLSARRHSGHGGVERQDSGLRIKTFELT